MNYFSASSKEPADDGNAQNGKSIIDKNLDSKD